MPADGTCASNLDNLERLYGVKYDPATEVIITVGGSEALYLSATALLDPAMR
jgi:aminotransferase